MHYGGSTLMGMPASVRQAAYLVNYLDTRRARGYTLTAYHQALRFWAYSKVRRWQHKKG